MKRLIFFAGLSWMAFFAFPAMGQDERVRAEREAVEAAHAAAMEAHAAAERAHADAAEAMTKAQADRSSEETQALLAELAAMQQTEEEQRSKMRAIRERLGALHQHHDELHGHAHDAMLHIVEHRHAGHDSLRRATQGLADGLNLLGSRLEQLERFANEAEWASQPSRDSLRDAMHAMDEAAKNILRAVEQLAAEAPADDSSGDSADNSLARAMEFLSEQNPEVQRHPAVQALAEVWARQANQSALSDEARLRALDLEKAARRQAERAAAEAQMLAQQARQQADATARDPGRFQQLEERLERIEKALERLANDRSSDDDGRRP